MQIILFNNLLHFLFQLDYLVHYLAVLLRYQRFGFNHLIKVLKVLMPLRDLLTLPVPIPVCISITLRFHLSG